MTCAFVVAYAKSSFSHDVAHAMIHVTNFFSKVNLLPEFLLLMFHTE